MDLWKCVRLIEREGKEIDVKNFEWIKRLEFLGIGTHSRYPERHYRYYLGKEYVYEVTLELVEGEHKIVKILRAKIP